MPDEILINEVGPRDGLQNQSVAIASAGKIELIEALLAAGLRRLEVTAFVSPKAVPQMADAAAVVAGLRERPGVSYSALVPNVKGLERAASAGVQEIAVVLACTGTMNRMNIGVGLAEANAQCSEVIAEAKRRGLRTKAYLAVAFGCPYEGAVASGEVLRLADQLAAQGADQLVFADTIGAGAPAGVGALLRDAVMRFGTGRVAAHLHDTRGLALANCWAGIEAGVRQFDSSVGGLGGCPFAPGAAGNLATEDLVALAEQCGFATGVDLARLYAAISVAERLTSRPLGGRTAAWWRGENQKRLAMRGPSHAAAG